ncbi:MAG: hypothetical protein COV10_04340 [Candidatus Vogelbacteria bacterium CG10_big_fil_rev_8_21_14_0_10_51_16]|uniref:HTH arsR-type domain-containing protein n=1 Tax=Candidatus Vogelbacteria bacterium CG10_big_fil_rev_8_21_14_0_10_51_16 TaxID=1975045 RepID=A0A2H0RDR8_9BACT|nr:MAG: hypothetical protein COV10_04340 [Candidatus Vogelbacteria bacterium CG10_big_fil_rev_8_21_14_0_10_51_16]
MNYKKYQLTPDITKKARLLSLAGDETRIRILCLMFEYGEACVTDIAESLGSSVANISNHLQPMKDNGYFISERMGNNVCYKLVDNEFNKSLKKIICD